MGGQHRNPTATPPGNSPGRHCTGGSVGPKAGLNGHGEEKISCPLPGYERQALQTLTRMLFGPRSQSGRIGEEENFLSLTGFETRVIQPVP
jgi:hypothetical protein